VKWTGSMVLLISTAVLFTGTPLNYDMNVK